MLDAIIIGGGPAGLSAALVLARCRRRIVVFDDGHPRNAAAKHSHNVFTRDGAPPTELLRLAAEDLRPYNVPVIAARVTHARCCQPRGEESGGRSAEGGQPDSRALMPGSERSEDPGPSASSSPPFALRLPPTPSPTLRTAFEVTLANGQMFRARKLLLATGVRDVLPGLSGIDAFYGKGVHHCPYCDAYEYADQPLTAFGDPEHAVGLALALRTWSADVTACTHGSPLDDAQRARLARNGIQFREDPIARLEGDTHLQRIVFTPGSPPSSPSAIPCRALFFNTGQSQQSHLPRMLGCELTDTDQVVTHPRQHTRVSGLYLAGDADGDTQFIIVAAAEGATAACALNRDLQDEDRGEAEPITDAWRFTDVPADSA